MKHLICSLVAAMLVGCAAASAPAPAQQSVVVASASYPSHTIGVIANKDMVVFEVYGSAEAAGFQSGDILISIRPTAQIDDVPMQDVKFADAKAAHDLIEKANYHDGLAFTVTVLRDGRTLELMVNPSRENSIKQEGKPTIVPNSRLISEGWNFF